MSLSNILRAPLCLSALLLLGCEPHAPRIVRETWQTMGTLAAVSFREGTAAENPDSRRAVVLKVQSTYKNLENLLSAWNPNSELSRLARAGYTNYPSAVSACVRPCYEAAFRLKELSNGAFDPYVGKRLRELGVGGGTYSDLDLGAIAKGFAVDAAAAEIGACAEPLLIDLGGNLRAVGPGSWRTGIRNPFATDEVAAVFRLESGESTATSGNYERFIERNGVRYSHILDGRTGGFTSGIAGVTVITPPEYGAMLADGLSTTLFILGPSEGNAFLSRHYPKAEAIWIPDAPESPRLTITANAARRLENAIWPIAIAGR